LIQFLAGASRSMGDLGKNAICAIYPDRRGGSAAIDAEYMSIGNLLPTKQGMRIHSF
jgi:hypothetical protein